MFPNVLRLLPYALIHPKWDLPRGYVVTCFPSFDKNVPKFRPFVFCAVTSPEPHNGKTRGRAWPPRRRTSTSAVPNNCWAPATTADRARTPPARLPTRPHTFIRPFKVSCFFFCSSRKKYIRYAVYRGVDPIGPRWKSYWYESRIRVVSTQPPERQWWIQYGADIGPERDSKNDTVDYCCCFFMKV